MSHLTRVAPAGLVHEETLTEALTALGATVERNGQVADWFGRATSFPLVAHLPNKAGDLGFERERPDDPFTIVADWDTVEPEKEELTRQIIQEYQVVGALAAARKAGWRNLTRKRAPNGDVLIAGTAP